jgi:hypothetical protein
VQAADGIYQDDLSYGPQPWLRGCWRDRLATIDRDIEDLVVSVLDRTRHEKLIADIRATGARISSSGSLTRHAVATKTPRESCALCGRSRRIDALDERRYISA